MFEEPEPISDEEWKKILSSLSLPFASRLHRYLVQHRHQLRETLRQRRLALEQWNERYLSLVSDLGQLEIQLKNLDRLLSEIRR